MRRRLEDNGAAPEGGEIHTIGLSVSEVLMRANLVIGGRGASGPTCDIVPPNRVSYEVRPETYGGVAAIFGSALGLKCCLSPSLL